MSDFNSWVRAQELGAIVNCILLLSLCFTIFVQAVKRLITIEPVDKTKLNLYILVGIIGLGINVLALIILGGSFIFLELLKNSKITLIFFY